MKNLCIAVAVAGTLAATPDAGLPQNAAPPQDAESILRRASAAYGGLESLQAEFVMHVNNPLLRSETTSRGQLFQRQPDRFLMRFDEPAGDVIVGDGQYFWVYYPSVDPDQVYRSPAGPNGAGGIDLRSQFVGDPVERFESTLEGQEPVDGRDAFVLNLVPRQQSEYRSLKVWIDSGDHLVRLFEITDANGVVRRIELRGMRVNPQLGDDVFQFTPPANARIVDRG